MTKNEIFKEICLLVTHSSHHNYTVVQITYRSCRNEAVRTFYSHFVFMFKNKIRTKFTFEIKILSVKHFYNTCALAQATFNTVHFCTNFENVTLYIPGVTVVGWNLLSNVVVNSFVIKTSALIPGNTRHCIFIKERFGSGTLWIAACSTRNYTFTCFSIADKGGECYTSHLIGKLPSCVADQLFLANFGNHQWIYQLPLIQVLLILSTQIFTRLNLYLS